MNTITSMFEQAQLSEAAYAKFLNQQTTLKSRGQGLNC